MQIPENILKGLDLWYLVDYIISNTIILMLIGDRKMVPVKDFKGSKRNYKWVKDRKGDEYLCPVDVLKDPKHVSDEELKHCVCDVDASVNPRGG